MSTWFQVYEARFGKKLTESEIEVWESEIQREIRNLGGGDVTNAVRAIAENRRKVGATGKKYAPTVEDVITEIIRSKYRQINPVAGEPFHVVLVPIPVDGLTRWHYEREAESSWKPRLTIADEVEAWNIICEPCSPEECRERREYCDDHGIIYRRAA